jgi:hypothetical protein
MTLRRSLSVALACSALALPATMLTTGCGGAETAKVQPGEMPAGETWTGVYFHPLYGYLHLVETDNNVVGKWIRADHSAWGEMSGVKEGNVLHFTWKEHKIGFTGPSGTSKGKGYFVYGVNKEKTGTLTGQFGLGDEETGSEWNCVKQLRMTPELDTIPGTNPAGLPAGQDNWK